MRRRGQIAKERYISWRVRIRQTLDTDGGAYAGRIFDRPVEATGLRIKRIHLAPYRSALTRITMVPASTAYLNNASPTPLNAYVFRVTSLRTPNQRRSSEDASPESSGGWTEGESGIQRSWSCELMGLCGCAVIRYTAKPGRH